MNRQVMQFDQTASRIVTVVTIGALIWAVCQAVVGHNPPLWVWIGGIRLT